GRGAAGGGGGGTGAWRAHGPPQAGRAASAGGATPVVRATERSTLASGSDPRRSLGSVSQSRVGLLVEDRERRLLALLGLAILFEGYGRSLPSTTLAEIGRGLHGTSGGLSFALAPTAPRALRRIPLRGPARRARP